MTAMPAERRFMSAALACCYAADFHHLRRGFDRLPDARAVALGKTVSDKLSEHARIRGDWRVWAASLHHLPRPGEREARQWAQQQLGAWTVRTPESANNSLRRLRALACKLIRAGTTGRELLRRLDAANATLEDPVSAERIGNIAIWAATAAKETRRAA